MQVDWTAIWTVFFAGAGVAITLIIAIGGLVFLIMKLMLKPVTDKMDDMRAQLSEHLPQIKKEPELIAFIQKHAGILIDKHEAKCPMKK